MAHWGRCVAFVAATAQAVELPVPYNQMWIDNESAQILYVLFDWETGMGAPSNVNFHVAIPANTIQHFDLYKHGNRKWTSFAAITAANGSVGVMTQ